MQENDFGNKISSLRKEKGYTQAYIAEKLGVTPAAVSKWENGGSKPRVEVLFKLAELLNVNAKDLLSQGEETTPTENLTPPVNEKKIIITLFAVVAAAIFLLVVLICHVTVPNLTGMDCILAEQKLEELGLKYQAVGEYHETIPQNTIISQTPKAGSITIINSTVTVTVSKGRQTISMPQVVGFLAEYGIEKLERLGMQVVVETCYDERYENDEIVFQSEEIGNCVYTGTAITIYVNKKP